MLVLVQNYTITAMKVSAYTGSYNPAIGTTATRRASGPRAVITPRCHRLFPISHAARVSRERARDGMLAALGHRRTGCVFKAGNRLYHLRLSSLRVVVDEFAIDILHDACPIGAVEIMLLWRSLCHVA